MSWKGFFLRAGILSDGSNIALQRGNLTVQGEIIPKGIAPDEITTADNATLTIAQLITGFVRRDPTGASRSDVFPTAALMVAGLEGIFVGATFDFTIANTGSVAEIMTLTLGTDITLSGTMTIAGQSQRRFRAEFTNVTADSEAVTIRSLGAGDETVPTLTQIDDSALYPVGHRYHDEVSGSVYIYLKGVANVAEGWVVTFLPTTTGISATAEIVGNAQGMVAVALAAIVNGKFGWFQIAGLNLVVKCDTSAQAGKPANIGGITGAIDHTPVIGDLIVGMFITVAESSNVCGVFMNYPSVTDEIPAS